MNIKLNDQQLAAAARLADRRTAQVKLHNDRIDAENRLEVLNGGKGERPKLDEVTPERVVQEYVDRGLEMLTRDDANERAAALRTKLERATPEQLDKINRVFEEVK